MLLERNIIKAKDSAIEWIHSNKNLPTLLEHKDDVLLYVYPCKNCVKSLSSSQLACKSLQGIINRYYSYQIEGIQAIEQEITSNTSNHGIVNECYERLNMVEKPLVMQLCDEELTFLIGHECGHGNSRIGFVIQ